MQSLRASPHVWVIFFLTPETKSLFATFTVVITAAASSRVRGGSRRWPGAPLKVLTQHFWSRVWLELINAVWTTAGGFGPLLLHEMRIVRVPTP